MKTGSQNQCRLLENDGLATQMDCFVGRGVPCFPGGLQIRKQTQNTVQCYLHHVPTDCWLGLLLDSLILFWERIIPVCQCVSSYMFISVNHTACLLSVRPLPEKLDKISSQNNFFFFFCNANTQEVRSVVILIHLKHSNLFLSVEGRFIVLNCRGLFLLACSPIQIEWLTKIYLYDSSI